MCCEFGVTPGLCWVFASCPGASPAAFRHFSEKCVMNNYFGIGLDAKISLEFNNKRDEHPKKCRLAERLPWKKCGMCGFLPAQLHDARVGRDCWDGSLGCWKGLLGCQDAGKRLLGGIVKVPGRITGMPGCWEGPLGCHWDTGREHWDAGREYGDARKDARMDQKVAEMDH